MRSIAAVTTCHRPGYDTYGRRMLQSFDRHWPQDIRLLFHAEGFTPDVASPRIDYFDLMARSPGLVAFKQRHADSLLANGKTRRWRPRPRFDPYQRRWRLDGLKWGQGFRWDAVRFAHKTFAIFDAARTSGVDVLVWLDADTLFFNDIPRDEIESWVPQDRLVGYLRRPTYSECGVVAYNLRHPLMPGMLADFEAFYTQDAFLREYEFHDSYLFDRVRKRAERRGAISHDIADGIGVRAEHVLVNSRLGRYMDHLKGPRKDAGKSRDSDLVAAREEDYWRPGGHEGPR